MSRFTFTPYAEQDIDDVGRYLQSLPEVPALRIGKEIQMAIQTIAAYPAIGRVDHRLTQRSSEQVLRFVCGQYVLFYYVAEEKIRIVGLIHGKRDVETIMRHRLG